MKEKVIVAFREMKNEEYQSVDEIMDHYTQREVLETFLEYEGIIGYANYIMELIRITAENHSEFSHEF